MEDVAKRKIHKLLVPSVHQNDFMASNHSHNLGKKMDIIAWTMNAMPILPSNTVQSVLGTFKAVEIPLEHTLHLRYHNMKTGSQAILSIADALARV